MNGIRYRRDLDFLGSIAYQRMYVVQLQACLLAGHLQQHKMKSLVHDNVLNPTLVEFAKNVDNSVACVKNPLNRGNWKTKLKALFIVIPIGFAPLTFVSLQKKLEPISV